MKKIVKAMITDTTVYVEYDNGEKISSRYIYEIDGLNDFIRYADREDVGAIRIFTERV